MLIDPTGQKPSIIIDVTFGDPSKFTCSTFLPGQAAEESEKPKRNKWKTGGLDLNFPLQDIRVKLFAIDSTGALGQSARES